MQKIVVFLSAGYACMHQVDFWEISDDITHSELDDMVWHAALDHAEMYGIYNRSDYDDSEIPEDEEDKYSDSIEGHWELYDPEKHDCFTVGGSHDWQTY